jgi:hypothetical protein
MRSTKLFMPSSNLGELNTCLVLRVFQQVVDCGQVVEWGQH